MAIQEGNIRLLKSQVMDDVPEGGGRATGNVILDGLSNSIFPDISELDRAGGRVNLRKAFVGVNTVDQDGYYGVNVVVSDPPDDPRVSCTLFTTADTFDTRTNAQSRLESYLAIGPVFSAFLFSNHLAGQRSMTMLARHGTDLPVVGQTLVLNSAAHTQFVRLTDVAVQVRTFEDDKGTYERDEYTVGLSDPLRYDFPGYGASRVDIDPTVGGRTILYETVVADAARYYGVTPLTVEANVGDFSAIGESTFTSLVPSAQVETPIADARMNQQSVALTAGGGPVVQTIVAILTPTQAMYIGGSAIVPDSFSLVRGGTTLVDKGGKIVNQATLAEVGQLDYDNGILSLVTDVFGPAGGTHVVTYTPATPATVISLSYGVPVTEVSQRLTYAITLVPAPAKRSLQVSYLAQGRWYVLTEDGTGRVAGSDSAVGIGNLNFETGTLSLTLGALPDEGSEVILSWAPVGNLVKPSSLPTTSADQILAGRFFIPFQLYDNDGKPQPIKPGSLTLTWDDDGVTRTVTDNNGALAGDGVGVVKYSTGLIRLSPSTLPAVGTAITVSTSLGVIVDHVVPNFLDGGANWTASLGQALRPKTVDMAIIVTLPVRGFPGTDTQQNRVVRVFDDGLGQLQIANVSANLAVGTVDYSNGAITLFKNLAGLQDIQTVYKNTTPLGDGPQIITADGTQTRVVAGQILNGAGAITTGDTIWKWWTGANLPGSAASRFGDLGETADNRGASFGQIYMSGHPATFSLGSDFYKQGYAPGGGIAIMKNPSAANGEGEIVGTIDYQFDPMTNMPNYNYYNGQAPGAVKLTDWATGVEPVSASLNSVDGPALSGPGTSALVESLVARTAIAPIRNNSFSLFCLTQDGQTLTATSNEQGYILGSAGGTHVYGTINYATGVLHINFGSPAAGPGLGVVDISHLGIPDVTFINANGVRADTLRYNASAYTYLPLSADLLGLDPVRLPSDGKVPIFRAGSFAVISHTAKRAPAAVSNGQTINLGRTRISRIRVVGNDKATITAGYSTNLDDGTITFNDVTGYSQPVVIENRIEDMMLVSDAQLGGRLTFTRPITHDYPSPGSYLSSALVIGDMHARESLIFDQQTWANVWADTLAGNAASATFNDVLAPIAVTNAGAITERWALVFTNTTAFNILGEHVGLIGTGVTTAECAPTNPSATGSAPYFRVPAIGWGGGWAAGNVLRFNTVGALYPIWIARTIQQGPATAQDDSFTLLVRGDIDRP